MECHVCTVLWNLLCHFALPSTKKKILAVAVISCNTVNSNNKNKHATVVWSVEKNISKKRSSQKRLVCSKLPTLPWSDPACYWVKNYSTYTRLCSYVVMGRLIGIVSGAKEYRSFFYVSGSDLNNFSQIPIL